MASNEDYAKRIFDPGHFIWNTDQDIGQQYQAMLQQIAQEAFQQAQGQRGYMENALGKSEQYYNPAVDQYNQLFGTGGGGYGGGGGGGGGSMPYAPDPGQYTQRAPGAGGPPGWNGANGPVAAPGSGSSGMTSIGKYASYPAQALAPGMLQSYGAAKSGVSNIFGGNAGNAPSTAGYGSRFAYAAGTGGAPGASGNGISTTTSSLTSTAPGGKTTAPGVTTSTQGAGSYRGTAMGPTRTYDSSGSVTMGGPPAGGGGGGGTGQPGSLTQPGVFEKFAAGALSGNDPYYKLLGDQGRASLDQEMNAGGNYGAGARLAALGKFNANLGAQQYHEMSGMQQAAQDAAEKRQMLGFNSAMDLGNARSGLSANMLGGANNAYAQMIAAALGMQSNAANAGAQGALAGNKSNREGLGTILSFV